MSQRLIANLYPLADALQLRIGLDLRDEFRPKVVMLDKIGRMVKVGTFELPIKLPIKWSAVTEDHAGVVVHLGEHLSMLLWYRRSNDRLSIAMIDSHSILGWSGMLRGDRLETMLKDAAPGFVRGFTRTQYEQQWTEEADFARLVDGRHESQAE
jgi:hypothetical protein